MIEAWGDGVSTNSQICLLVGILIVTGVAMILGPKLKGCFFTEGQSCVCDYSWPRYRGNFSSCRVVKNSN
jgi:hypothetical protein